MRKTLNTLVKRFEDRFGKIDSDTETLFKHAIKEDYDLDVVDMQGAEDQDLQEIFDASGLQTIEMKNNS